MCNIILPLFYNVDHFEFSRFIGFTNRDTPSTQAVVLFIVTNLQGDEPTNAASD